MRAHGEPKTTQIGMIGIQWLGLNVGKAINITKFNLDGPHAGLAYAHTGKGGYHAWISPDRLAVFVLGAQASDPSTLQPVDLRTGAAEIIESSVGRSLTMRPGKGTLVYVHKPRGATSWEIKELNPDTRKILPLTDTVEGSEDFRDRASASEKRRSVDLGQATNMSSRRLSTGGHTMPALAGV